MADRDRIDILVKIFSTSNNNSECNFTDIIGNDTVINDDVVLNNIRFTFSGLGILLLTLLGIPANILSVILLTHPKMKSSLSTLLLGLTISDIFMIATSFLMLSLDIILNRIRILPTYYTRIRPYIYPWIYPINCTAQMSSIYFTICITLERYIAIRHPHKYRSLCTRHNAMKTFFSVVIISILYNFPRWFEYHMIPKTDCDDREILWYEHGDTEFGGSDAYLRYYYHWGHTLVILCIPIAALVYFNVTIYKGVMKQRALGRSLSLSKALKATEDNRLAIMLMGIVITFLVCYIPKVFYAVDETLEILSYEAIEYVYPVGNFLEVLSHSTNFVFYFAFGTLFRQRLRKSLRRKGISRRGNTDITCKTETSSEGANENKSAKNVSRDNPAV